jgi:uncharacterized protein
MKNILSHTPPSTKGGALIENFRSFIDARTFPCVGAKSALNRDRIEFAIFERLGSVDSARVLQNILAGFSARHPNPGINPISFVAIFREQVAGEDEFHRQLWAQLQAVHDLDSEEYPWAPDVSEDAHSAEFSFSVASRAFFVVGLHPRCSRLARRSSHPTLVFNFHGQFEALREAGRYEKLQEAIRERDTALQGNINPMLARFGDGSEARQYSGRAGGECPFHSRSV